ncbi:hypothetical protein BC831DRAFT_451270 [Entophlyctis helioformis]|nr:hypothetical protein BC831DRAFT_451270 [Entophlyctis helioformis]
MAAVSFGKDLWDQTKIIESYAEYGAQFMEKTNEFMKQMAVIESEYGRNVQRLVKQYKDDIARKSNDKVNAQFYKAVLSSTLSQSFVFMLNETEQLANQRVEMADKLDTDIRKSMKHRGKDNEKANKQHFDDARKASADLRKAVDNLERHQQRYEKAMKDLELAQLASENANKDMNTTKKIIEQLRADTDKKAALARDAGAAYKACMAETNDIKNKHFRETLPSILDVVQREDEEHKTNHCKGVFIKYVELFASMTPKIEQSYRLMGQSFETINAAADSELFVNTLKTGEPIPEDFQMSDTQETDVGKKTFMKGMTKVREDKADDQAEDQIISLPAKQGRKKAVDRVKHIEKEIADVEKKRQGIETLIVVYKDKPAAGTDPKIMEDLSEQKLNHEKRIDTLQYKRHKLMVYISTVDGVPAPEPPTPVHARSASASPITPFSAMSASSNKLPGDSGASPSFSGNIAMPSYGGSNANVAVLCRVRVLYDFEAAPSSQEMNVRSGQILDVLEKQDDGWWRCRDGDREGYVPGNYVESI